MIGSVGHSGEKRNQNVRRVTQLLKYKVENKKMLGITPHRKILTFLEVLVDGWSDDHDFPSQQQQRC